MAKLQIASGFLTLSDGTCLPMRHGREGIEVAVGAVPTGDPLREILDVLEPLGQPPIIWRSECWNAAHIDTRAPRGNAIPPAAPSRPRPEMARSIEIREDCQELVFREGGRYRLSHAEFAIFLTLYRALGKAVRRNALILAMYGAHDEPDTADNVLSITVMRCRKKLGGHGRIEAVWGVGYRLVLADDPDFHEPPPRHRLD